jgi:peroxiredoxin Q/BCP
MKPKSAARSTANKKAAPKAKPKAKPAAKQAAAATVQGKIKPGMKAPAFKLPRDGGGEVSLADFKGQKIVLYFYPKADTPGCTKEAIDFSRLAPAFAKAGATVLGVSADPVKNQDKFKAKHDLKVALGSDETHKMLEAYGVWAEKSMYGLTYMGVLRNTYLIGPDGKIAQVWESVKVPGHAEEVLEAAKGL